MIRPPVLLLRATSSPDGRGELRRIPIADHLDLRKGCLDLTKVRRFERDVRSGRVLLEVVSSPRVTHLRYALKKKR
jgi:hypothetical protein